jgi:hypothetical protein
MAWVALGGHSGGDNSMPSSPSDAGLEKIPANESARIDHVADLTRQQVERRYGAAPRFLRGVHPKDHGCLDGVFAVSDNLPPDYRVGVFKTPGERFRAIIRFSNASPLVTPDSLELGPDGKPVVAHGSRGMAVKLYYVNGNRLLPEDGENTQDFLMINQPVFAFANVEDYEVVSELVAKDERLVAKFFERLASPDPAIRARAARSRQIIGQVKSLTAPPSFQPPPMSPLDNRYFSAAPFMFGPGRVMKYAVTPVNPMAGDPGAATGDPDYLRKALRQRMAEAAGKDICFDFQVQVRSADSFAGTVETEIEDVCTLWDEAKYPFVTVGRITVPAQDVTTVERQEFCETLFYTPWHGLDDHRPIGGINRLRQKVYEVSSGRRGCPVSPALPPLKQQGPPPGFKGFPTPPPGKRR